MDTHQRGGVVEAHRMHICSRQTERLVQGGIESGRNSRIHVPLRVSWDELKLR